MIKWIGAKRNADGHRFNNEVAAKLRTYGWEAKPNRKVTEVLNTKLSRNYGDVDVLAWNRVSGRVLIIECKDLHSTKTHGEIAKQLQGFRGHDDCKGKPDKLKKHLERVRIIRSQRNALTKYVGCKEVSTIETHLVFRNLVPMLFSDDGVFKDITFTEYNSLGSI
jgi:hypothetical protein